MFSEQIQTPVTVLASSLVLVLIVFSVLRKMGQEKESWIALFILAYPLLTVLLLVMHTTWPAEATSLGIGSYAAGKAGGLFVVSCLSMVGLLHRRNRIVGMLVVLVCLSWNTYVTGYDPFRLALPDQLPPFISPILLALFYWLWKTYEGDRIYDWLDQSTPSGFGKLRPRGSAVPTEPTDAQTSARDPARAAAAAWAAARKTSSDVEREPVSSRSTKAEPGAERPATAARAAAEKANTNVDGETVSSRSTNAGPGAERPAVRMAVGAAVGAASVYALMMIAAAASANRFSYAMANDPQMMLWPTIAGAVIGAGITALRR